MREHLYLKRSLPLWLERRHCAKPNRYLRR